MPSDTFAAGESSTVGAEPPALGSGYSGAGAPPPRLTPTQQAVRDSILRSDRPEDYEVATCPCGSSRGDRLLAEVDRHGIPCRNVICLACGLIRLSPRWREPRYRRFYQSEYRSLYNRSLASKPDYALGLAASPATLDRARWIERMARRYGVPGAPRLVELGAGAGWNLAGLPISWIRVGYDVDDEYLAIGRKNFGVEMRHGFVEEALESIGSADLVLLSHVVEHFPSPESVLETIGRRLRPGALLLIEVPGLFRLHRSNLDVRSYLQNAHTFTYCAGTLHDACRRAGLEVLEVNEFARAVCRPGSTPLLPADALRTGLAKRIIRYLRWCDSGFRHYVRLQRIPGVGSAAAALWKRTYFAALGLALTREVG